MTFVIPPKEENNLFYFVMCIVFKIELIQACSQVWKFCCEASL